MTESRNITQRVTPMIDGAIERHRGGDDIVWDTGVVLHPEQGPMHVLTLNMPSAIVGSVIHSTAIIPSLIHVTEADLDKTIPELIENMRQQRTEMLRRGMQAVPA